MILKINDTIYDTEKDIVAVKYYENELSELGSLPRGVDLIVYHPHKDKGSDKIKNIRDEFDKQLTEMLSTPEQKALQQANQANEELKNELEELKKSNLNPIPFDTLEERIEKKDVEVVE